jgi:hypothetical protein
LLARSPTRSGASVGDVVDVVDVVNVVDIDLWYVVDFVHFGDEKVDRVRQMILKDLHFRF